MKSSRRLIFGVKLLVSVVAVGLIVWLVDWGQVRDLATAANPFWLFWVFVIVVGDRLFMAMKWAILLRSSGVRVSTAQLVGSYYLGAFWGTFLPASVGGDVVRVTWLVGKVGQGALVVSSVVIERLLGALALGIVAALGLVLFTAYLDVSSTAVSLLASVLLVFSALAVMVVFNRSFHRLVTGRLSAYIPFERVRQIIARLSEAIWHFRKKPRVLGTFLFLSMVEQLFPIVGTYWLAKAFGVHIPFMWVFIGIPIILAVARIPISVQNFGIQEGVYVFVFAAAGVPPASSIVMSLTGRAMALLSVLPGALLMLPSSGFRNKSVSADASISPSVDGQ